MVGARCVWRPVTIDGLLYFSAAFVGAEFISCASVHAMNDGGSLGRTNGPVSSSRDELRLRILRLLELHPEMTQREIARELGVSLGGVNYALKALIERGFVKAGNFGRSENKSAYLYLLTPAGLLQKSALAATFLSRKLEEYEALKQEIESLKREVSAGQEVKS